jgi:hypothetical protein
MLISVFKEQKRNTIIAFVLYNLATLHIYASSCYNLKDCVSETFDLSLLAFTKEVMVHSFEGMKLTRILFVAKLRQ